MNDFNDLFSIVFAASKDKIYLETSEKLQQAFHELIIAEANSRRNKITTLIKSMAKIDCEIIKFKQAYSRIYKQLTLDAIDAINQYLKIIEQKKKDIIREKDKLKK